MSSSIDPAYFGSLGEANSTRMRARQDRHAITVVDWLCRQIITCSQPHRRQCVRSCATAKHRQQISNHRSAVAPTVQRPDFQRYVSDRRSRFGDEPQLRGTPVASTSLICANAGTAHATFFVRRQRTIESSRGAGMTERTRRSRSRSDSRSAPLLPICVPSRAFLSYRPGALLPPSIRAQSPSHAPLCHPCLRARAAALLTSRQSRDHGSTWTSSPKARLPLRTKMQGEHRSG
jgi:hypothetical protein